MPPAQLVKMWGGDAPAAILTLPAIPPIPIVLLILLVPPSPMGVTGRVVNNTTVEQGRPVLADVAATVGLVVDPISGIRSFSLHLLPTQYKNMAGSMRL